MNLEKFKSWRWYVQLSDEHKHHVVAQVTRPSASKRAEADGLATARRVGDRACRTWKNSQSERGLGSVNDKTSS
jgi:hypothetical protein